MTGQWTVTIDNEDNVIVVSDSAQGPTGPQGPAGVNPAGALINANNLNDVSSKPASFLNLVSALPQITDPAAVLDADYLIGVFNGVPSRIATGIFLSALLQAAAAQTGQPLSLASGVIKTGGQGFSTSGGPLDTFDGVSDFGYLNVGGISTNSGQLNTGGGSAYVGYLWASDNAFIQNGLEMTGNFFTGGGNLYTDGGMIYTSNGGIDIGSGTISGLSGLAIEAGVGISTGGGYIKTNGGVISTFDGDSSYGSATLGACTITGDSQLFGNLLLGGTLSDVKSIYFNANYGGNVLFTEGGGIDTSGPYGYGNINSGALVSQAISASGRATGIVDGDGTDPQQVGYRSIPGTNMTSSMDVSSANYNGFEIYFTGTSNATLTIPDGLPEGMTFTVYSDSASTLTVTTESDALIASPSGVSGPIAINQFGRAFFRHLTSNRWSGGSNA